ncbi:hypothetical protein Bcav_3339 [Beutenbergia cavernae DSM 12333]|uniref:Neutral/alkaline non-lysosomal ceramidase N-terminal domain-containing protein n=1 Tax=Beutenbergia cavernae (strain ATCC BAA-8 / DSM 12333 / CCUG 43141 / JCM 11478 / NBRC 16432 / NCIMB 13614 / HKI 0122) TaxID=471853 RepID=C5C1H2_BEUC1|nr:hypothetical protein [Beutenbergia cavernae]ACQ81582.1 hypothetical protein Bcav_3339 [Beutenbergia cavernae DSM 12333]
MTAADLRIGTDRTDITPTAPVPLAGYASRAGLGPASVVLAPLHVRSLALRAGGRPAVVLVSADLLWWADDVVAPLRAAFAERFGLPPTSLVLHATHNHSGPQTSRLMTPSLGPPDDAYLDHLVERTLASIGRALDGEVPVSVETVRTPTEASVDRRWARTAGEVPRSPIDRDLTLVRFVDASGATAALLAHFACHPVVHHGNAVTSDLAGTLADVLERETTPFAMYLQGCCGDVNPARYAADGTFANGGQDDVEAIAAELAHLAARALPRATSAGHAAVAVTRRSLPLPLQDRLPLPLVERMTARGDVQGEWARIMAQDPDRYRRDPVLELVKLRLTPDLALLGMSGEPVSRFGLHAKEVSGGRCLPMGYTDGMTTYLVTARHLEEGGYEPCEAPVYFAIPAPLAPGAERAVLAEISALAAEGTMAGSTVGNEKLT